MLFAYCNVIIYKSIFSVWYEEAILFLFLWTTMNLRAQMF